MVLSPSANLANLYDQDFLIWVETTVQMLKDRKLDELDFQHLIEEVEDLGKRDKREVQSNLVILLTHLLKWQYQPERRSYPQSANDDYANSWARTISEHRDRIQRALKDSPSLWRMLETELPACYQKSRKDAAKQTGLKVSLFPELCPYPQTEILNDEFWPD